jgi:hypothetical protein
MKALRNVGVRRVISKCPWREREPHTTTKPLFLTDVELQDIAAQISENGYRALPFSATGKQLFRCPDCNAVWLASSIFERVSEEEVCGVYDVIPIWTPHPSMEKGK